jgi:glyoxylase-like metal-dependent hydrolase (beta-lactamase superfamily II)
MQDHIYTYQLGGIALTIISEGTLGGMPSRVFSGVDEAEWRPLVELDSEGRIPFGINIVHVAFDGHSILLDTGVGEPHPARAKLEQSWPYTPTAPLVTSLVSREIDPERVTMVIFSHAHSDHIMGATNARGGQRVPTFPNARYVMMHTEWMAAAKQAEPDSAFTVHMPILQDQHLLELIEDGQEVAPGIRVVPAPGESPGHAIVRMESRGKLAFYLGDLFHHTPEVTHLDWVFPGRDVAQSIASREALVAEALSTDAVLISAHMLFPGLGKLRWHDQTLEWVAIE